MIRTQAKSDVWHRGVFGRQVGNLSYERRQIKNLSYMGGFTLLEVMLALGLTLIVVLAVGSAIAMYLRVFDSGRDHIEEAQLARTILQRMADDIRGGIHGSAASSSSAPSGGTSASSSTTSTTTGGASSSSSTTSTSTTSEESSATVVDEATDLSSLGPQKVSGLYGNATQLQVDLSRLPRLDQYMSTEVSASSQLGDMRNITYFVVASAGMDAAGQAKSGLMRRDLERISSLYASQYGQIDLLGAAESIAPEVQAIQFSYYSGEKWLDSWDSNQMQYLPLAVQITISIARPADKQGKVSPPGVYSIVVQILAPVDSSSATADATTPAEGTSDTSSSNSDSNASGSTTTGVTNSSSGPNTTPSGQPNTSGGGR